MKNMHEFEENVSLWHFKYCKTGNFRVRLFFANFAIIIIIIMKINIREYVCLVL